jgi:sporulation protein YlmC with PRC-barrel domain
MTSDELVDKPVKDANGEEVGEINAIVVDRDATQHAYAVVEYGGVLGIGEKEVLVDLEKLELTADGSIRVPATDEDAFSAYPRYEEKLYQKYEGDLGSLMSSGG